MGIDPNFFTQELRSSSALPDVQGDTFGTVYFTLSFVSFDMKYLVSLFLPEDFHNSPPLHAN
jgi:hypothetical protein